MLPTPPESGKRDWSSKMPENRRWMTIDWFIVKVYTDSRSTWMYYSTSRLPLGNQYVFPNNPRLPPWKFYVFYRKITKRDDSVDAGDDSSTTPIKRSRLATCFVAHLDHAIVDGGSLSMTIMPKLLDFDDESTDPTAMFQNLRPFTRFQRALMNVQGFLKGGKKNFAWTPSVFFKYFFSCSMFDYIG